MFVHKLTWGMSIAAAPWSSPLTNTWKVPSLCLCTPILVLACGMNLHVYYSSKFKVFLPQHSYTIFLQSKRHKSQNASLPHKTISLSDNKAHWQFKLKVQLHYAIFLIVSCQKGHLLHLPPAFILNLALWARRLFDIWSLLELFIHEAMVLIHYFFQT